MGICYELREANTEPSSIKQKNHKASSLVKVDGINACSGSGPIIVCMDEEEFADYEKNDDVKDLISTLMGTASNYVDEFPGYIVGSFAVPTKEQQAKVSDLFAFYMDKERLVFIDNKNTAEQILNLLAKSPVLKDTTPAHCLYLFCKHILVNDLSYLTWIEAKMERMEESLVASGADIDTTKIMEFRRKSLRFNSYYQQMATMVSAISDNENGLMTREEAHAFDHIESLADKLASRAESLKEYSLQLYELQQTQIDLKQNSIMQVFTIMTVLFAPLTLITGWFGMNLSVIPGIDFQWMWLTLIVFAVIFTVFFLILFKKKHWL